MKKNFLFPVLAVVLAVSGAYAAHRDAPIFYSAGNPCNGEGTEIETCTPSDEVPCLEEGSNLQYYYRPNGIESDCEELLKEEV